MIWQESFTISPVSFLDANQLIRECDFPAMLDNPLGLLMFTSQNCVMSEEEILWKIDGLEESLQDPKRIFRKICKGDGTAISLLGGQLIRDLKEMGECL